MGKALTFRLKGICKYCLGHAGDNRAVGELAPHTNVSVV